jgi:hypothetical protein
MLLKEKLRVGIAMSYGLHGRGSIPGRVKVFLFSTESRQALSRANSASYPVGTKSDFCEGNSAGAVRN